MQTYLPILLLIGTAFLAVQAYIKAHNKNNILFWGFCLFIIGLSWQTYSKNTPLETNIYLLSYLLIAYSVSTSHFIQKISKKTYKNLQKLTTATTTPRSKKQYNALLWLIYLIAVLLRLINLGELGLWWDELITGRVVSRILETGIPYSSNQSYIYWRGFPYHYILAGLTSLFGESELLLRLPSVFFGTGIVILASEMSKKINYKLAPIIALFLAFSPFNIEFSRFARFYIMHAFLFISLFATAWKGYINNKTGFKILTIITAFILTNTVQLGAIGIAITLPLLLHTLLARDSIKIKIVNGAYLLVTTAILLSGNILEFLFKKTPDIPHISEILPQSHGAKWKLLQLPEWHSINFLSENHLSAVFLLPLLLTLPFLIRKYLKEKKVTFILYLITTLATSILAYEIGSRGVSGARIFLFLEALWVPVVLLSIYLTIKAIIKSKRALLVTTAIAMALLAFTTPHFYSIINRKYGDDVSKNPFNSTHVANVRADYNTTYSYLKDNKKEDDVIIVTISENYFILKDSPSYVINQGSSWNEDAYINEKNEIVNRHGTKIINTITELENILQQNNRVWIVLNGANVDPLTTTHIDETLKAFLRKNNDKKILDGKDSLSALYLFENEN